MSFESEYEKLRKKRLKEAEESQKSTSKKSFAEQYDEAKSQWLATEKENTVAFPTYMDLKQRQKESDTPLPLLPTLLRGNMSAGELHRDKEEWKANAKKFVTPEESTIFQSGAFDDGYQFGDVFKSVIATAGDTILSGAQGFGNFFEGIFDLAAYGTGEVADWLGMEDVAEQQRKAAEYEGINTLFDFLRDQNKKLNAQGYAISLEDNTLLGDKGRGFAETLGGVGGMIATAGLGGAVGLSAKGASALGTASTFASSTGSGIDEAYKAGATDEDAWKYGATKGVIDAGTELMFGGLGKGFGALGIGKSAIPIDDILAKKLTKNISNVLAKNSIQLGVKGAAEGVEELAAGYLTAHAQKGTFKSEEDFDKLIEDQDLLEQFVMGALAGGMVSSVNLPSSVKSGRDYITGLTANEQTVVDKEIANRIADAEKDGKTLTKKDKSKIESEVLEDLKKGYISTDTIESALGGDTYKSYQDTVTNEESILKEYEELGNKQNATLAEQSRYAELQEMVKDIKDNSKRTQLQAQLSEEVQKSLVRDNNGKVQTDDFLLESYNERARRGQTFEADVSKYDAKQQATIQKAIDSGILNNTRRTHDFVDMVAKISADKGVLFDFANNEKIKESGFAKDGKFVNGYVTKDGVTLNINSSRSLNSVVGHEITHVLEGTELYTELQNAIKDYAVSKKDYKKRLDTLKKLYEGVEGADINAELTADLVGDYLFTDSDFISHLSTKNRNVFQKIYDEIKYLCKIATAGSKEARQLEKVKRAFDKAYKESGKTTDKTSYSLDMVEAVQPTSDKWKRTHTTEEAKAKFPKLWDIAAEDSEVRNPTQIASTTNTYRKIYNYLKAEGFDGTILDASSGLGYGTKAGIEEYGFDVEDIEPYPDKNYTPKYTDYSKLDKKYDAIISSFVLNVLPQDQRDALVVKMGELLNAGGKMFINVRSNDVESLAKTGKNIHLGNMEWIETTRGSYQKGFKKTELVSYLQDALGDGYTVEPTSLQSPVAAIVTKKGGNTKYSLSAEQQEYFKDSKVRDENGNLKVMYHGTSKGGHTVFDTFGESRFGLFGAGTYFTDNKDIAESYTEKGRGNNKQVYESYLNITNPIDMDAKADVDAWKNAFSDADYSNCVTNEDCFRAMKEVFVDEQYPQWEAKETAMDVLQSMGYDGITHIGGGRVNADGVKHQVYIAFEPEQIKNIDNLKPTSDPDIRYSLSEDSEGTKLTKEQEDFFRDSKMRDDNGDLTVMYHGSQDAGFHEFDNLFSDDVTSFFFVDNPKVAKSYSGTDETYTAKTFRTAEDFNRFFEEIGADEYEVKYENGWFDLFEDGVSIAQAETAKMLYDEFRDWTGLGTGSANYKVYLNLKNPLVVEAQNSEWDAIAPIKGESPMSTREYAQYAKENGYDGVIFKNIIDNGAYASGIDRFTPSTVAIAFESNQIKSVANATPTEKADIRYSLSDYEGKPIDTARISSNEFDTKYSLSHNSEIAKGQTDYIVNNRAKAFVTEAELAEAQKVTNAMVDVMMKYSSILPEDKIGKVLTKNGSYDRSVENTTICVRTLAYNEFVDKVQEEIGRPLTQMESFLVSQKLYDIATEPQCLYCYVSLDRKAFNDMLLRYMQDRDSVIAKYNNSDKSNEAIEKLYEEFLHGRKPTKEMRERFDNWLGYVDNGTQLLSLADIATEDRQSVINANGGNLAAQLKDARKYAQSASWSKIQKNYVAYRDEILKLGDRVVKNLNEHYGLRWYSFSDYSAAFIVENMQQITDASIRGLKGLSYTKDTDFAEIFAPSGMNVNISVFVNTDANGNFYIDEKQSANFEKAKELRERYPNVGIVATVTNDEALRWAGEQEWSDVIIPFHIVRTGTDVAEYYKWLNYTSESADTVSDKDLWNAYVDSLNLNSENARKKVSKNIYPNEHKNDKATYLNLCESRGLSPRFARFAGEDWYMKLVNETRLSADNSSALKPTYDLEAAQASFQKFIDKGGYEGGWYKDGVNVDAEAKIVAEDVLAGKKANEVDYGRQDGFIPEDLIAGRKNNRKHGQYSLSFEGETPKEYGNFNFYGKDMMLAPADIAPVQEGVAENVTTEGIVFDDIAPTTEYEAIKPKPEKLDELEEQWAKNKMARADKVKGDTEQSQIAKVLDTEPTTESERNQRKWAIFKANVLDKGAVFEDLSLKTKNRKLMGKWNYTLYSDARAQRLMGEGAEGVKSLNAIREEVGNTKLTKQFYEYMYHKHNVDRMRLEERYEDTKNKPVFGYDVTAEASQEIVNQYEFAQPEFKRYAQDVYDYMNHLRKLMVDNGVISQETADLWAEMYPHYVPIRRKGDTGLNINVPLDTGRTGVNAPIKKATGGNRDILPLFDTIAQRTAQTYKAIAKNSFGIELKNTLGSTVENTATNLDEVIDSIDVQDELLKEGKNGKNPTFTVFENGERVTFEITEDMYDAMKPLSDSSLLSKTIKPLNVASNIHRGLLTEYNPVFMLTNAVKDIQDVLMNSQHAAKTYAKIPEAYAQMFTKGYWYKEYMENGGDQNTYFDNETNTFKTENKGIAKMLDLPPFSTISKINNFIEMTPRLAEYIASREAGASVEVAMLDAARVTTNFKAGGDFTKLLNRNGATFLNASVQGAMQQVRNVREAKANGLKGWVGLATKFAVAGLPAILLNNLVWEDDEDYEELSDYVKDNYYVVAKYGDGQFVRIPKGRTVAVIQEAIEQVGNALSGDDEADFANVIELAVSNLAPNNPIDNNILAPIIQVANNETWYGEDLVPTRLQDLPAAEQFDESTDALSKWLGETLDYSPYKINYLLNQYSGGLGDVLLPMMTPEAESGDNSLLGNISAPLKDKFTTDSVMNNQNVSDFYETVDELTINANGSNATDKDILKSKYINSVSADLGELYKQKREIQNSDLADDEKYAKVRDIQAQINALAKNSLNTYGNVKINGEYATIGDRHFKKNEDGEWQKVSDKQLEKQNEVTSGLGIDPSEYWSNKTEYDFAYEYPEKYAVAKSVGGYDAYKTYSSELYDIKADKDENGKSISGSRKEKVIEYINNLDADYGEKLILFKSEYNADDTYNYEIIDYLNSREDISYEEMETILKELGFTVKADGTIEW